MELLLIIAVVVGVGIFIYKKMEKAQQEEARKRALENKKKKEMEEEYKKRFFQLHDENLPRIYDKYSVSELQLIYKLLYSMHRNGPDNLDDSNEWMNIPDSYYQAKSELSKMLNGEKWKELDKKGNIYYCDSIPSRTVYRDMNYVYGLLEKRN